MDAVLAALQQHRIALHLAELEAIARTPGPAMSRLASLLRRYAEIRASAMALDHANTMHAPGTHADAGTAVAALLHQAITDAAGDGAIRTDIAAHELARFCEHAVGAAGSAGVAGAQHVATLALDALRPPP